MIVSDAARGVLEHLGRLLERAGVKLDEQVHGDAVVVFVLVEAHVGEELAHAVVAERREGERLPGLGSRAALDVVGIDRDGARGDPGRAGDHPFPAVLDRLDAAVGETEVRLVVHAVEALHDGLLELVDDFGALAGHGVDLVDPLVVDLDLEVLRPAAVAAQPAARAASADPSIGHFRRLRVAGHRGPRAVPGSTAGSLQATIRPLPGGSLVLAFAAADHPGA